MGCHSYLIWSDWILCEDLLHVGGFFLIRKFFFCSYDTLNISNVCLKVLLEWYILPTWYILIYNEFLFQNRFQANMVTYQNLITKSMYDKQLDSGKGTLLHLCDDVIQQEVCNPHYVIDKFNLSCMCHQNILNLFLQVKEVIVSYYILMEQGKATIQVTVSP